MRRTRHRIGASLLAIVLAACSLVSVATPDPATIPDGPLEAHGSDATGPVVELGTNVMEGRGWRYAIYPSTDGWCLQLETVTLTSTSCGDLLPGPEDAFGTYSTGGELGAGVTVVDGIVSDAVATVWLVLDGGGRAPAQMLSLEPAGQEGQAFLRLVPDSVTVTHLQAVAMSGEILDTIELP